MKEQLKISDDLHLPVNAVTQTFAILARKGSGKTYTGAVFCEEMLAAGQQVIVVDVIGVWHGLRSSADGKSAGYPVVIFGGEHADVPLEETAGETIALAIVEHGFSAILDLSLLRKAAVIRFMTAFAETLYRVNRKPMHLMLDEADVFAPQRPMDGEQRMLGALEDIVRRGRARGIGVTMITQRPAVLNKNVLTQVECLVTLQMTAPQDRAAIDAWVDLHGAKDQRDLMMESLPSLPVGTAWFWSPQWLNEFRKIRVRLRTTFDSSATPKVGMAQRKPKAMAPVDIQALGAQIQATVEQAKANDPSLLRQEVKRLTAALQAAQDKLVRAGQDKVTAVEQAIALERRDKAGTRPLDPTERRHLKFITKKLQDAIGVLDQLTQGVETTEAISEKVARIVAQPPVLKPAPQLAHHEPGVSLAARRLEAAAKLPVGNFKLTGGLKRMLTVLVQRHGLNTRQLGLRAGLSSKSGTFTTYLGALRSQGLIHGTRDGLYPTDAGIAALGPYSALPTGPALVEYWCGQLSGGARRMLEFLAEQAPGSVTKESLGLHAGISHVSGTFTTYLGKLRTLELVETMSDKTLRLSEELQ